MTSLCFRQINFILIKKFSVKWEYDIIKLDYRQIYLTHLLLLLKFINLSNYS